MVCRTGICLTCPGSLYMLLLIKPILFIIHLYQSHFDAIFYSGDYFVYFKPGRDDLNQRKVPRTIAVLLIYSVLFISDRHYHEYDADVCRRKLRN